MPPPFASKASAQLAVLTIVVGLAHGLVLQGVPSVLAVTSADAAASFSTRMLAPYVDSGAVTPAAPATPTTLPAPPRWATQRAPATPAQASRDPDSAAVTAPSAFLEADSMLTPPPELGSQGPTAAEPLHNANQLLGAGGPPADLTPEAVALMVAGAGSSPAAPDAAAMKAVQNYAFPPSTRLKYNISGEVKGFNYYVKGDLQWKHDDKNYEARLEISHFLLGSRVQTSRGEIGPQGLEPIRFGDKVRSERAAHFDKAQGKVTFSANTPDARLVPGTQDLLSLFLQLTAMLAGSPGNFPEGTTLPFEAVSATSRESWIFKVGPTEKLALPGGTVTAIKLAREAVGEYGTRVEIWLAPSMGYVPVRILLTEASGDHVDKRWSETVAP